MRPEVDHEMRRISLIFLILILVLFFDYAQAEISYLGEDCHSNNNDLPIQFIHKKQNATREEIDLKYEMARLHFAESFWTIKSRVYHSSEELKKDTGEVVFDYYNNLIDFEKDDLLLVLRSSMSGYLCKLNIYAADNTLTLHFYYILPLDVKFPHASLGFGILKYKLPKNKQVIVDTNYKPPNIFRRVDD